MLGDLTYIAVVVLVPLIPAFLLYKYLPPRRTDVGGPFKGLDIKLSGAFAGYFLVVLIVTSLLVFLIKTKPQPNCPPCPQPPIHRYEVYTVRGKIKLRNDDASYLDYTHFDLSLVPPERGVNPDGSFSFEIPVKPGQEGQPVFPSLVVTYSDPAYERLTIHLDRTNIYKQDYTVEYNEAAKTIDINPQIHLESAVQPYRPGTTAKPYRPTPESSPEDYNELEKRASLKDHDSRPVVVDGISTMRGSCSGKTQEETL